ncbi:MAG: response regulator [Acidimicrobiia bacterium]|nr:response regulator [Acidimicrobiia bacterium]
MSRSEARYRAVVIDDHPLLAAGLRIELERAGIETELAPLSGGEATSEIVAWIVERSPDVVVADLGLPLEGGGLALVEAVAEQGVRVAVLTGETGVELWADCLSRGAKVVLSKVEPLPDIIDTVLRVCVGEAVRPQQRAQLLIEGQRLSGERWARLAPFAALSTRERQVLAGLIAGYGPAQLADRDYVSVQTVRSQIKSVLRKLGVRSQLEAVGRAHAAGWSHEVDDQPAPSR